MNLSDKIVNNLINNKKTNFYVFLLVLLLLTNWMVQAHSPLYAGHDFFHHWNRLNGLCLALKNGTFPWYINYNGLAGAGYFVKAFYCDIPLLPFAAIGLLTNPLIGYQSMVVGTTILCGISCYVSIYKVFRIPHIAFISSILYTFCAYRLLDLFVRNAMGEIFTFIFLPVFLWGFYDVVKRDYRKWYILALAYSFIIFSHIISAIIIIIPIILLLPTYYKSVIKEKKRIRALLISSISTILLTAYYIFPMVEQMLSNTFYYETRGLVFGGLSMTLKIWHIFNIFFDIPMLQSEAYSFKIGFLLSILICIRIFVRQKSKKRSIADWFAIVAIIITIMTTNVFPWKYPPFSIFSIMQFSFRLLMFSSLLFSVAGAIYVCELKVNNRVKSIILILILVVSVILIKAEGKNYITLSERDYDEYVEYTPQNTHYTAYGKCEYLPNQVPSIEYLVYEARFRTSYSDTTIENPGNKKGVISFYVNTNKDEIIETPLVYYKGYRADIDGKPIEVRESKNGMIELPVEQSGMVFLYYNGTFIQKASTFISIIAILLLIIYMIKDRRKVCKKYI